jgi:hypothetical protein
MKTLRSLPIKIVLFGGLVMVILFLLMTTNIARDSLAQASSTSQSADSTRNSYEKDGMYTPSDKDLAIEATGIAEISTTVALDKLITPHPSPTSAYYPVKSEDDIQQVVLHDPYFQKDANDPDYGPCIKAANPGKALFVKYSDDSHPDYYVVPFYMDDEVCGIAVVGVEKGIGMMGGWTSVFPGNKEYPYVNVDDAIAEVQKLNYQIDGKPILAFQYLRGITSDMMDPFWKINTTTGETFYVINRGINKVAVLNAKDVYPIP